MPLNSMPKIDLNALAIIALVGSGLLLLLWVGGRQGLATECLEHYPPDHCLSLLNSFWF